MMAPFPTTSGGFSAPSSAAARSGDIRSLGDTAYGGINIGANNGINISNTTLFISLSIVALYFIVRKRK
jgi:hypothetical protein